MICMCEKCGQPMRYYDAVKRTVLEKNREATIITVKRFRCRFCNCIRRILPDYIYPYKQYNAEIIKGVVEGFITCETFGFEDYPCEMTMTRWRTQKSQLLL